ncbi:MAG TPA: radical SAM protein [bacterium]|nr:radical SAM protein [bacterium]
MTEITFEITNYCPSQCSYCSNESGPNEKAKLSFRYIQDLLKGKVYDRINVSGGEPLSHPDFYKILIFCKRHVAPRTGFVAVYTNAIECIMYNANILPGVRVEANLPMLPNVNKLHVLKMIPQGSEAKRPDMHYSKNWNDKNCNHDVVKANGKIGLSPCDKREK